MFALAHKQGDILREGWQNLLVCILQLLKGKMLPVVLTEVRRQLITNSFCIERLTGLQLVTNSFCIERLTGPKLVTNSFCIESLACL